MFTLSLIVCFTGWNQCYTARPVGDPVMSEETCIVVGTADSARLAFNLRQRGLYADVAYKCTPAGELT